MSKMDYPDIDSPSWRPRKPKKYHWGAKINANGDVSALCFEKPRAINLSRASWTNRKEAVTCPKCLTRLNK
jgi:hypothetical protein